MGSESRARYRKDSAQSRSGPAPPGSDHTGRFGSFSTHDWVQRVRMGNTEDFHGHSENRSLSAFTCGPPRANRQWFAVLQLLSGRAMEIWIGLSGSRTVRRPISQAEGNVNLSCQSDDGRNATRLD